MEVDQSNCIEDKGDDNMKTIAVDAEEMITNKQTSMLELGGHVEKPSNQDSASNLISRDMQSRDVSQA